MISSKLIHLIKSPRIKNFIIYGFGQAINLISPLLVIPYLIIKCGEEGLGKVGVGFSFALIAIVLVDYGSYINGTKEISINHSDRKILEEKFTTIYLSKLILLFMVLLLCSVIIFLVPFFAKDKLQLLLSLVIVVGQFINPIWFFQGINNFKWISAINIFSKIIYVVCVFLFIKKPEDYIYINLFLGFGLIVASTVGFLWIYNHYSFSLKEISFLKAIELIRREFTLTVSQLFFSLYQYAPIIVISYVLGDFMAGQYRIIDQIIMIFRTYFQMFFNFSYADVCLKIFDNKSAGIKTWLKYNGYNYIFVLFLLICFGIFSQEILDYFKVASTNTEMVSLFLIGLFIPVFMGITFALKQLVFSFNENKRYILVTIISTIFTLGLMFILLKTIGLKGSFITTIIVEILIGLAYIFILKPHIFVKKSNT